jgi:hypothetical protein
MRRERFGRELIGRTTADKLLVTRWARTFSRRGAQQLARAAVVVLTAVAALGVPLVPTSAGAQAAGGQAGATAVAAPGTLLARIEQLEARLAAAEAAITTLEEFPRAVPPASLTLEDLARFVRVEEGPLDGLIGPHVIFEGANVHIRSGAGATDDGSAGGSALTGRGNLVIGYNEPPPNLAVGDRAGSHTLIIGPAHRFKSFGGMVAGQRNTVTGPLASVSGGLSNTASGANASVSGGFSNTAGGREASVSGGENNTASGNRASVSGGSGDTASGNLASVSGGLSNTASGVNASVSGGSSNTASGNLASVSGGSSNTASGVNASVSGGQGNTASGLRASVSGGENNNASAPHASVSGGGGQHR